MTTQSIVFPHAAATGHLIDLPGAPLIVAHGAKGFVMCSYLDVAAADRLGTAAAVVKGVKTIDELLAKPVVAVSRAAAALGVTEGMTGRDALERLA
jgi:uncharacterized protein YunC (DUF1805 family)